MLDEEVTFIQTIAIPQGDSLVRKLEGPIILAGTVAGYALTRTFTPWWEFFDVIIGGGAGLLTTAKLYSDWESGADGRHNARHIQKYTKEDTVAIKNGAQVVTINYRGNGLPLVIRPEYEQEGKLFSLKTNDPLIGEMSFAYSPQAKQPYKFRFKAPKINKRSRNHTESLDLLSHAIDVAMIKTLNGVTSEQAKQTIEDPQKDKKREREYAARMEGVVSTVNERLKEEDDMIHLEMCGYENNLEIVLLHEGTNTPEHLELFGTCASNALQATHYFFREGRRRDIE